MFRLSYIDSNNNIAHKGGFKSDAEAYRWLESQSNIAPIKLLIWSDELDCYETLKRF